MIATPQAWQDRFWAKVQKTDSCWLWTASTNANGYGQFNAAALNRDRPIAAHRVAYEMLIGPVPDGLEIDHLCRVPACVNPAHLEAVTHAENVRRGRAGAYNSDKTHCPSGHPYDEANTHWYRGQRYCRACTNADTRRRYQVNRNRTDPGRWRVEYRRVNQPTSRVFQVVVRAADTDDARRQAQLLDPHYGSTTRSPRRYRETA